MFFRVFVLSWLLVLSLIIVTTVPVSAFKISDDIFQNYIQEILDRLYTDFKLIVSSLEKLLIKMARLTYSLMAIIGLIFWITKINRYLGRDLIFGALILAFVVECAYPTV